MLVTLLFACAGSKLDTSDPSDTDTDTDTDADSDADTDADTDTDTDTDTDADTVLNHGILEIVVAGRGEGFDLDGDGSVDNALFVLGSVLDPLFASLLGATSYVPVVQLADVDDAEAPLDDAAVQLALVSGADTDGDPGDNGSGTEVYAGGAAVDGDGRALVGTSTALAASAFSAALLDDAFTIGSFTLQSSTPVYISGTVDGVAEEGLVGLGVSTDALATALTAAGAPDTAALVEALADLDTDADSVNDAVSMAFTFHATSCEITP